MIIIGAVGECEGVWATGLIIIMSEGARGPILDAGVDEGQERGREKGVGGQARVRRGAGTQLDAHSYLNIMSPAYGPIRGTSVTPASISSLTRGVSLIDLNHTPLRPWADHQCRADNETTWGRPAGRLPEGQ